MQIRDVPQDEAILGDVTEISYALDDQGRYVMVETAGWEPSNVANQQAWDQVLAGIDAVLADVRAGRRSPLAYHMARCQMNAGLLASYAGRSTWVVRRHLKPGPFRRLRDRDRERYAAIFRIPVDQLGVVPPESPKP